jgi:hypothetical protein
MMRKFSVVVCAGLLLLNTCGCVALLAGGAAGAGTAAWLSGKLTQEMPAPYDQTINATKSSLQALNLPISKETRSVEVDQIKGKYSDGRDYWVDIRPITDHSTKVEVRVGVKSDKAAASAILSKIQKSL